MTRHAPTIVLVLLVLFPVARASDHVGRLAGLSASARRTYIESRLDAMKVPWSREAFSSARGDGVNLVVRLGPTTGPATLFSANYDVAIRSAGAHDNATGCAVLLELARTLPKQPSVRLILVFFDGTKRGLAGSGAWAALRAEEGLRISATYHFASCGRGPLTCGPVGRDVNTAFDDVLAAAAAAKPALRVKPLKRPRPSDRKTLGRAGIDAVTIGRDIVPVAKDRAATVDPGAVAETVRLAREIARRALAAPRPGRPVNPTWSRDRRAVRKALAADEVDEVADAIDRLEGRGLAPLLIEAVEKDPSVADLVGRLVRRHVAGEELRRALDTSKDAAAMRRAWAKVARRVTWDAERKVARIAP